MYSMRRNLSIYKILLNCNERILKLHCIYIFYLYFVCIDMYVCTQSEEIYQYTKTLLNYNECILKLYCNYILYFMFVFCAC